MEEQQITEALIREIKYRLYDESMRRIRLCLDQLTDEQVWWRPNEDSNSIGNLLLHLSGNMRQWVYSGLGGYPDNRKRQQEFDERTQLSKEELWETLSATMQDLKPVIEAVTPADLLQKRPVQTFEESGLTILIHVTEHFSYHTGQIAWITKMLKARQLGFYEKIRLE
jgi:uncharacterized damage-inducible protein DinB